MGLDAMIYMACGRWANLQVLDIRGLAVGLLVLQVLLHPQCIQSKQVVLTAKLGDAAELQQLADECQKLTRLPLMRAQSLLHFTLRFPDEER